MKYRCACILALAALSCSQAPLRVETSKPDELPASEGPEEPPSSDALRDYAFSRPHCFAFSPAEQKYACLAFSMTSEGPPELSAMQSCPEGSAIEKLNDHTEGCAPSDPEHWRPAAGVEWGFNKEVEFVASKRAPAPIARKEIGVDGMVDRTLSAQAAMERVVAEGFDQSVKQVPLLAGQSVQTPLGKFHFQTRYKESGGLSSRYHADIALTCPVGGAEVDLVKALGLESVSVSQASLFFVPGRETSVLGLLEDVGGEGTREFSTAYRPLSVSKLCGALARSTSEVSRRCGPDSVPCEWMPSHGVLSDSDCAEVRRFLGRTGGTVRAQFSGDRCEFRSESYPSLILRASAGSRDPLFEAIFIELEKDGYAITQVTRQFGKPAKVSRRLFGHARIDRILRMASSLLSAPIEVESSGVGTRSDDLVGVRTLRDKYTACGTQGNGEPVRLGMAAEFVFRSLKAERGNELDTLADRSQTYFLQLQQFVNEHVKCTWARERHCCDGLLPTCSSAEPPRSGFSVSLGVSSSSGPLAKEVIERIAKRRVEALKRCYLRDDGTLDTSLARRTVNVSGVVSTGGVLKQLKTDVGAALARECMASALSKASFPPTDAETETTFVLTPDAREVLCAPEPAQETAACFPVLTCGCFRGCAALSELPGESGKYKATAGVGCGSEYVLEDETVDGARFQVARPIMPEGSECARVCRSKLPPPGVCSGKCSTECRNPSYPLFRRKSTKK